MYKINLAKTMKTDFGRITQYIRDELYNSGAAEKFATNTGKKLENLNPFPKKYTVHESVNSLDYEYRRFIVGNYIVFYTIDEENNKISIIRILHERQDSENVLV